MKQLLAWVACVALGWIIPGPAAGAEKTYAVTVDAGKFDRINSIVEFDLPKDTPAGTWYLVTSAGKSIAVQMRREAVRRLFFPRLRRVRVSRSSWSRACRTPRAASKRNTRGITSTSPGTVIRSSATTAAS